MDKFKKSLKEQTDEQIEKSRSAKPKFMQAIDEIMVAAKASGQGKSAIKAGQKAPDFELIEARGKKVSLSSLLEPGPVVLSFYRGGWRPYCNLQIRALQTHLKEIQSLGAQLVAITPQIPDESLSQVERDNLEFLVLSDLDAKISREYGIAWEVPKLILEHMINDRQLDLVKINDGNGSILPMPATFILTSEGIVSWSHVDVDYRARSEPSEIIDELKKLSVK